MQVRKKIFLLLAILFVQFTVNANVSLPKIFSDNMVLQRNKLIPVWGWADTSEIVTVQFKQQIKKIKTSKSGTWLINLDAEMAGGPFELIVSGKNNIHVSNILVGDIWLCSGQSNMEWNVRQSDNSKNEISLANYPLIRHLKIPHNINAIPENDINNAAWKVCDSTTVSEFSAIGYFFAKNMYDSLKVPIGLINASWGGTIIETWIARNAFENSAEFKEMIAGLPEVNLDSITKLVAIAKTKRIELLQNTKLKDLNTASFKEIELDDAKWPEMIVPKFWELQSVGDIDGVVWLRKTINLTESESNEMSVLELSKIDDEDVTYVNGILVGSTKQWDLKRHYTIASGVLKAGKNVIAIRITDNGQGGGIYGDAIDLKITVGNKKIPLAGNWKFMVESIKSKFGPNSFPSLCFNSMIHPLIPFAIQGVLWYQGEANVERALQYRIAFPLLINDWRKQWSNPSMPFYYVQLAPFNYPPGNSNAGSSYAELREAQTLTLQLENTGMAVTTDVGNPFNIHPTNKQIVGKRLSAIALNNLFNRKFVCEGPLFKSIEMVGDSIVANFANVGSGLVTTDKYGYLKGFELAGADSVFYYAKAYIKNEKVVIYSENVSKPIALHFGWAADASECNLFNKEGFPAIPFRTDDWKTVSKNERYSIEKL
jgi:sialate O-acetylesterase